MSFGTALGTGFIVGVFALLAAAARGRLRRHAGKDGAFLPYGGSSDSGGSAFDADGGGGGDGS